MPINWTEYKTWINPKHIQTTKTESIENLHKPIMSKEVE